MEGTKSKRYGSKNILVILGFLFFLAVIALITVGVTQNKPLPKNVKYGIVLDAGSSHTNMYIYNWPAEKENDTGVVQQVEVCHVQGSGISGLAHKIEEINSYLNKCMDRAQEVIPKEQHRQTPVYLGATAGMRLLRMESSDLADKVLETLQKVFPSYPFDFQGARIITGQEEGAYGWITINYLLGKFNQRSTWINFLPQREGPQETFGALDLGGASTQITFVPLNEQIESQDNSLHFRLYGKSYNVYTHSFLCYGKDQALRLKLVSNIQDAENGLLRDPCFHPDYEKDIDFKEFFNTPCVPKDEKSSTFQRLKIQGTGNYSACRQSIQKIFNTTYCPYSRCSFNGVFLPVLQGDFGAFSAFYFVMDFLNLTNSSLERAINKMESFCSQPWSEIKTQFPTTKEKYLSEYCFSGTYILTLLQLGYRFADNNWKNIHFMGKIGESDAGWTLGYMLNLTNMIPAERQRNPPFSHSTYVFLMVLFSLIVAAVFFVGWLIFRKPSCLRKGAV